MINLAFIKTFVTVADTGSFSAAADKTFITQPAVSQHIRTLEKHLGVTLFERQGKKVYLSSAGRVFLPYASNILKQYEEAKVQVSESVNSYNGTIRIATIYSIGLHDLQPMVRKFMRKYPEVGIHLEYHQNSTIYELILKRSIDFGLVAYPQKGTGFKSEVFAKDKLVLVQSVNRPVFKKKRLVFSELNHMKFIALSSNTPTQQTIDLYLKSHGVIPETVHSYDNIETLKSAVVLGMGFAIIPKNTILLELKTKSLEILSVDKLNLTRTLGILYPEGKTFTKSARTFLEMLTQRNSSK